jgi:hypothetical protein
MGCSANAVAHAQEARLSHIRPDSVVLERTSCFGTCPAYRLAVHASGRVAFESRNRGDEANRASNTLPVAAFARILTTAARVGFDTMPAFDLGATGYCRVAKTDHPMITVTTFATDTLKRLSYYTGCTSEAPDAGRTEQFIRQLQTLADSIDAAVGAHRWIRPGRCCGGAT